MSPKERLRQRNERRSVNSAKPFRGRGCHLISLSSFTFHHHLTGSSGRSHGDVKFAHRRVKISNFECISILWAAAFLVSITTLSFDMERIPAMMQSNRFLRYEELSQHDRQPFRVSFDTRVASAASHGVRFPHGRIKGEKEFDFGGLQLRFDTSSASPRIISLDHGRQFENYRDVMLKKTDEHFLDRPYYSSEDLQDDSPDDCRDVAWKYYQFPNCNDMHQVVLERSNDAESFVTYLR